MQNPADSRWNMNIHYHRLVIDAIPKGARTALDVGTGDGLLAFDLADQGLDVTGIDQDAASCDRARADPRASDRTRFVVGDILSGDLSLESFDLVTSVATLHHMDPHIGLARMGSFVRPGGMLVVVGFARISDLRDYWLASVGRLVKLSHELRGDYWDHNAPTIWPPPMRMNEMRAIAEQTLPGATFQRLMSLRFVIRWKKPASIGAVEAYSDNGCKLRPPINGTAWIAGWRLGWAIPQRNQR